MALIAVLALGLLGLLWASATFDRIETVDVSAELGGGRGTNYLIVGSDSREGVDADDPNAGALIGEPVSGQRSDTLLILRVRDGKATMLSIPRDLLVTIAETGNETRINAAYAGGPSRVIKTITNNLGIPIHHYMEIDLVSFAGLVDAVGGITINFPNPAFDTHSGLDVKGSGPVELNGTQALAYVRSRHYTERVAGGTKVDPTGDLGRVARQQQFLTAIMHKAGGTKNPLRLRSMASSMVGGLIIDDDMSMFDAAGLLWTMRKATPESRVLPVRNIRTSAGAAVLDLIDDEATPILDEFR